MLVENKIKENDVVAVKLTTGEELIGKVTATSPLTLSKPIVLGLQQQQNPTTGQVEAGLGFAPFMLGVPDDSAVTLEQGSYIVAAKARDEVKDAYISSTTGIEVPPTPSLVV